MSSTYRISQATRKRCKIIEVKEEELANFSMLSLELFHYLFETKHIDFNIYFRFGLTVVQYITPREFSHELLNNLIESRNRQDADLAICVEAKELHLFHQTIDNIRNKKIHNLLQKDPQLDHHTLQTFAKLSSASQMVVKGGIDQNLAQSARLATKQMIDGLMTSEVAVGTLSRMVLADPTLYDHSATVAMISGVIAHKLLKKDKAFSENAALGGLYHDVGKTCVPNFILNKPGSFTPDEFEIMKTHTTLGYEELLRAIEKGAPIPGDVALVAHQHHEKFMGGGYPQGRKGRLEEHNDGIHEFARIVSIADVYSALLMKRVYKEAYTQDKALNIMQKTAPQSFDPVIFGPFEENIKRTIMLYNKLDEKEKSKSRIIQLEDLPKALKKKSS